jgi:hypothetical protein
MRRDCVARIDDARRGRRVRLPRRATEAAANTGKMPRPATAAACSNPTSTD